MSKDLRLTRAEQKEVARNAKEKERQQAAHANRVFILTIAVLSFCILSALWIALAIWPPV
jgi:hypothetical protein